ncbi:MAG: SPOR domain-containing protein [Fidelibacterota bacterium]
MDSRKFTGNNLIYFILTMSLFAVSFSCISLKYRKSEPVKKEIKYDESFDPLSLNDDDIIIKDEVKEMVRSEPIPDRGPGTLDLTEPPVESVSGYRVQIYLTQDFLEADSIFKIADSIFIDEIYLIFDTPNYKIRVGDFLSRSDAVELQKQAISAGFRNAWIIRTKVDFLKSKKRIPGIETVKSDSTEIKD